MEAIKSTANWDKIWTCESLSLIFASKCFSSSYFFFRETEIYRQRIVLRDKLVFVQDNIADDMLALFDLVTDQRVTDASYLFSVLCLEANVDLNI